MIFVLFEFRHDGSALDLSAFESPQEVLDYAEQTDIDDGKLSVFDASGNFYDFFRNPSTGAYQLKWRSCDLQNVTKIVLDYMESFGAVYEDSFSLEANIRRTI